MLAEASLTIPGTEDGVTVGVMPLEVDGEAMTLRLAFTLNFSSIGDEKPITLYDMYPDESRLMPVLVDRENLKEHSAISETGQTWSADVRELTATNGQTVFWWGSTPPPEDDVDTRDLRVRGSMPEFTDIEVP